MSGQASWPRGFFKWIAFLLRATRRSDRARACWQGSRCCFCLACALLFVSRRRLVSRQARAASQIRQNRLDHHAKSWPLGSQTGIARRRSCSMCGRRRSTRSAISGTRGCRSAGGPANCGTRDREGFADRDLLLGRLPLRQVGRTTASRRLHACPQSRRLDLQMGKRTPAPGPGRKRARSTRVHPYSAIWGRLLAPEARAALRAGVARTKVRT